MTATSSYLLLLLLESTILHNYPLLLLLELL
jgi:hypothetical protein